MGELQRRDEQHAVQPAGNAVTPMQLLEMAMNQGADLDRLEKLMELQERWEANEARKAFVAALNAFKSNPPTLVKNKRVSFTTNKGKTEYDHATLDHVSKLIGDALAAHGLSHRWDTEQLDGGIIRVTCVLTHESGHAERTSLMATPDQSGGKNSIQAIGSTVSYLQRYTLLAATGMATQDQDDDARAAAQMDPALADEWAEKARAATTQAALEEVWKDGLAVIRKARDSRAYDLFKEAVTERGAELKAEAQS